MAGRRPVEEAFVARRAARRLLVVPQRRQALERLVLHATSLRIPVVEVEGGSLTAVAGFDGHQGIALVVEPRTWASIDDILARSNERSEPPFVLVLDSLEDPQNVGTLLRSAEAAGIHGVIFPTRRQAPLTPAAVKASAGAVEHLLLCPVDDLPGAMSDLRLRGLRIAAAEAEASLAANDADLRGPLAIVVGSEGQGLSPAVRRRADLAIRIPMRGVIGSLNAAVAGSILLFAAVAQRHPGGSEPGPPPSHGDRHLPSSDRDVLPDAAAAETPVAAAGDDSATPVDPPDAATTTRPSRRRKTGEPVSLAADPTTSVPMPTTKRRRTAKASTPESSASEPGDQSPAAGGRVGARRKATAKRAEATGDAGEASEPSHDLLPGGPTDG